MSIKLNVFDELEKCSGASQTNKSRRVFIKAPSTYINRMQHFLLNDSNLSYPGIGAAYIHSCAVAMKKKLLGTQTSPPIIMQLAGANKAKTSVR